MRMFDDRFQSCKFTRPLNLLFEHVIILQPKKHKVPKMNTYLQVILVSTFGPTNEKCSKNVFFHEHLEKTLNSFHSAKKFYI